MIYADTVAAASLASVRSRKRMMSALRDWTTEVARPEQLPPEGDWRWWLLMAGRRFGKTRAGAETLSRWIREGHSRRIGLVGPTAKAVRALMIEGESGLLAVARAGERPLYEPSKSRLTWPNGATATTYSAEAPEDMRGPGFDTAWADEIGAWRDPEIWDLLQPALSFGWARGIVTTTPRQVRIVRELVKNPACVVTRGKTTDNAANLSAAALDELLRQWSGTYVGRQELDGELIDDVEGALWKRAWLHYDKVPDLVRVVIGIDPAVTSSDTSDETGIVAAGKSVDRRGWVLADRSGRYTPDGWARVAVDLAAEVAADVIIVETNNGGDMCKLVLENELERRRQLGEPVSVAVRKITASRGKRTRAEPIAQLYEQGRVSHREPLTVLEDSLCTWDPEADQRSPDRLDAMVWALTELMLGEPGILGLYRSLAPVVQSVAQAPQEPTVRLDPHAQCPVQVRVDNASVRCALWHGHPGDHEAAA
jgi:phage terminase large subunit-like protein